MPDRGADTMELVEFEAIDVPLRRPPPKAIKVLVPVWGYKFVHRFFNFSLPTLLAPGNLPALARTLPTEFVFLTGRVEEAMIRESPGFRRLSQVCDASFELIDDLITEGNHSTTVTLAYARAVRRVGAAMLDTCFFFLVSDYIVADGSFASVIKRMMAGTSAVQAGNFQVVEEDVALWIAEGRKHGKDALVLPPRELMRLALACVHPATIANTVNLPVSHSSDSNRLFWRVDSDTLIGRFYLLHMLCIRPEITDFIIGASCDYCFIPEMCPTGDIVVMTDSDDYLVIEAQPRHHEWSFLRLGQFDPKVLANSLAVWTTALHRDNSRHTLTFHASEIPATAAQPVMAEADSFVGRVAQSLRQRRRKPAPYRNHPYWRGAMAAHHAQTGRRPDDDDWELMLGRPVDWKKRLTRTARRLFLGRAPQVRRWHARWADFVGPLAELKTLIGELNGSLLVVSKTPTPMTNWIADRFARAVRTPTPRLLRTDFTLPDEVAGPFSACLLEITVDEVERIHLIVDQVVRLLEPGAVILVVGFNPRWNVGAEVFGQKLTVNVQQFFHRLDVSLEDIRLLAAARWRWSANGNLLELTENFLKHSMLLVPLQVLPICYQSAIALGGNLMSKAHAYPGPKSDQIVSSLFMRLRVVPSEANQRWDPRPRLRELVLRRHAGGAVEDDELGSLTKEPQYRRLLEVQEEIGLTQLGLMTNQVWHEDPRRFGIILSRYKFVAKMLSGWVDVAEVGCGDAFGTRIVLQEAQHVTVYDFDPVFIDDIRRRHSLKWPIEAHVHDILDGPLPRRHNAIFSLDVIEHIPAEQEDLFLHNLRESISEEGVLLIGTPSLESQVYASPQSRIGHVNCKTGRALKGLLEKYFRNVFLFSMNDEVVHTGFYPMAHYLFAICATKKA
jgi:2-polyprenyl-3-methyl-5-hydroxy-6-metoxy-1,4-benzoquinol methylase